MDFDSIEGLSDEEINLLYDENILNKDDRDIAFCLCDMKNEGSTIWFGIQNGNSTWNQCLFRNSPNGFSWQKSCGYCEMGTNLKTESQCINWCNKFGDNMRIGDFGYYSNCFCRMYSRSSYWYECSK